MTRRLRFLPDVEQDLFGAHGWYEEQSHGLGSDFLRVFYAKVAEVGRNPALYAKMHGEFRRCLLSRFPYAMYYRVEDDAVIVVGVFHYCARDPRVLTRALSQRNR